MKKISVWTKLFWAMLVLIVSINVAIQVTGNSYMYKALIYTYADIDDLDIFDTRVVPSANPQPWAVSKDYNKTKITSPLLSELEKNKSVAFLVIKNDSIRYEQYWDHYDQHSFSNSFSVAKSIVSILVGAALNDGKIKSLDEPVGNYLPHFAEGNNAKLTIRHLLMMSSGLNWDESYSSLFSITTKAYYGTNLEKLANALKVVKEPGQKFDYMSGNTLLLAMVVEKATGMKLGDYASEKLWKQIGAEHSAQWSLDHTDGQEKAYCCFYSNARDFARFGKLYLDSGAWNGKQIVSRNYVRESLTPALLDFTGNETNCYGYQWWLTEEKGHRIFYARGLRGQYIVVIPDEKIIFVRLGVERGKPRADFKLSDLVVYIDEVLDMYGNKN
ncbi:MAG: serine hydrolase [Bacteroidetes bacterium]|nr:serine hydrolase [Bacteroidota bacterium]